MYWAIQNAGGMDDMDLAKFVERMRTVHAGIVEQDGAKAEPHTMDAPYASREALLSRLERDIFKDAMALDIENIASGANTATQIKAAYEPLNSKTDGYEYCVNTFIMGILALAGIDDEPTFTRSTIINAQEEVQMVLSSAQYLPEDYITQKLLTLMGDGDKTDEILEQMSADELQRGGASSFDTEDVVDDAERAAGKALSGIQTQSLISIMNAHAAGDLSEGQAAQLLATAVGIDTKQALNIIRGNIDEF